MKETYLLIGFRGHVDVVSICVHVSICVSVWVCVFKSVCLCVSLHLSFYVSLDI